MVFMLLFLLIVVPPAAALSRTPRDEPCPVLPLRASPLELHLTAGLLRHHSWIDFAVPEPDARGFVLCLDKRVFDADPGNLPSNGVVQVSVSTHWVDLQWILGRLGGYGNPSRWELVYTTCSAG
jgi:hypothetical protein